MFLFQLSPYNRANRMNHIITGQIECRSNFCLPCRFFMSLFYHHIITIVSKLNSRIGMNAIINTVMARLIASCHAAVSCIYDRSHSKSCNVTLPDIKIRLYLSDICQCDNPFVLILFWEIRILNLQKCVVHFPRHSYIHKRSEQHFLLACIWWNLHVLIFRSFF